MQGTDDAPKKKVFKIHPLAKLCLFQTHGIFAEVQTSLLL